MMSSSDAFSRSVPLISSLAVFTYLALVVCVVCVWFGCG